MTESIRLPYPYLTGQGASLEGTAPLPYIGGQPLTPALNTFRRSGCRTPEGKVDRGVSYSPSWRRLYSGRKPHRWVKFPPSSAFAPPRFGRGCCAGDLGRQIEGEACAYWAGGIFVAGASAVDRDCLRRPIGGVLGPITRGHPSFNHPAVAVKRR